MADVLILCGGQGTRLRSVIGDVQKVMAKVGDQPFLDLLIEFVKKQGFDHIVLLTGFKADEVETYYKGKFPDMTIEFSREDEPLGTGGAVKKAAERIRSNDFFVLNGDSFCPVDMKAMLEMHRQRFALTTIAVSKVEDNEGFGTLTLNEQGAIKAFEEKVSGATPSYVNAGVYCLSYDAVEKMPKESKFSLERDFFPKLVNQGFYGFEVQRGFYDIGTPERFEKARQVIEEELNG